MMIDSVRPLFEHSDLINGKILDASSGLTDPQLDLPIDMGRGTLRKTLMHIYVGEYVWLQRWTGVVEQTWSNESEIISVDQLHEMFNALWPRRETFLATLDYEKLVDQQTYRDSRGSLFRSPLHDMLLQGILHSTHHRAQAVNMIRRLGGPVVEVDYMYARRVPAE